MVKSTKTAKKIKPKKPRKDFPLYAHNCGKWSKKIKGEFYYFGTWNDPEGALQEYYDRIGSINSGRDILAAQATGNDLTMSGLCNQFLTSKKLQLETGELAERTFRDYFKTCSQIIDYFGKRQLVSSLVPTDFGAFKAKLAKNRGPVTLASDIQHIRVVFNFAEKNKLVSSPVEYGDRFDKPSKKVLRKSRNAKGPRMFEADDLRTIIAAAEQPLKAMILLGINCGFGQTDIATVPQTAFDLKCGMVNYPRPKTAIIRRCPLWPSPDCSTSLSERIGVHRSGVLLE